MIEQSNINNYAKVTLVYLGIVRDHYYFTKGKKLLWIAKSQLGIFLIIRLVEFLFSFTSEIYTEFDKFAPLLVTSLCCLFI